MEIKEQEIQERNKEIALMLGSEKKNTIHFDYWTYDHLGYDTMKISSVSWASGNFEFHLDWNWLMEAVRFINKTHNDNNEHRDLTYTIKYLLNGGYFPRATEPTPKRLMHSTYDLFLAISDFAKYYNKK